LFWERFNSLCRENKTNPTRIGADLGIKAPSVTKWKKGGMPSNENLMKIASMFNVTTDYLLGRTDERYTPAQLGTEKTPTPEGEGWDSVDGQQLLADFASLPAVDRQKVVEYAALLAAQRRS
jgi:transcriptional regulator with XRE-family HTH domain